MPTALPKAPRLSPEASVNGVANLKGKKRSVEETGDVDVDGRGNKKAKLDASSQADQPSGTTKDKKKRRKRSRRKSSVVASASTANQAKDKNKDAKDANQPHSQRSQVNGATASSSAVPFVPDAITVGMREGSEVGVLDLVDGDSGEVLAESPAEPVASSSSSGPQANGHSDSSELARLRAQVAAQSAQLERHQEFVSQHQQSLTCQICLELMHKPYLLSPCGHTACYGCLTSWFTALPNVPENGQGEPPRRRNFMHKKKMCPICRAVVTTRPIVVWAIKDMVAALLKSTLADIPIPPESETSTTPATPANDNGNRANANTDLWHRIFPPARHTGPHEAEEMGLWDEEDGVYRCIDCNHEIWGGVCTRCQREYPRNPDYGDDDDGGFGLQWAFPGGSEDEDDDDDELDVPYMGHFHPADHADHIALHNNMLDGHWMGMDFDDDEDVGDSEDDMDDGRYGDVFAALAGAYRRRVNGQHQGARIEEVSDEEREDSDYGGSFIDDGPEVEVEDVGGDDLDPPARRQNRQRRALPVGPLAPHRRRAAVIDLVDTEEEDEGSDSHVAEGHSVIEIDSSGEGSASGDEGAFEGFTVPDWDRERDDEEDDDENEDEVPERHQRRRHRSPDEEEEPVFEGHTVPDWDREAEGLEVPEPRRGNRSRVVLDSSGDELEEEEEEEEEDAPVRRYATRRRAAVAPRAPRPARRRVRAPDSESE